MKRTSLLIMAAGIGSRFGGGIKQLEPVGLNNELIIDYSIHDAIEAGFNKIIFVIRKDIEEDFKERIGNRIEEVCRPLSVEVLYCFQSIDQIPEGAILPSGRTKPLGTGQAVLVAKDYIKEPVAVINADDYYGKEAFIKLHDWLIEDHKDSEIAMAGFILKNTMSDNGGVTRGICKVSDDRKTVIDIVETKNIVKTKDGVKADGTILNPECFVSMNFWGFPGEEDKTPKYIELLEDGFKDFFNNDIKENPLKAEYLLPVHIGGLLMAGKCSVEALETRDRWFGVTYKEDKEAVVKSFRELIENGVYNKDLYFDL